MTWVRTVRPLALVGSGLLVVGCLLGARLFSHGAGGGTTEATGKTDPTQPAPAGKDPSGPIVIGYADSDPSPVGYGLPPVLPSGQIEQVYVKPGDMVKVRTVRLFGQELKVGDPLYKFDSRMLELKLADAQRAVDVAGANVLLARAQEQRHRFGIDIQKQKLKAAEFSVERAKQAYDTYVYFLNQSHDMQYTREQAALRKSAFENDKDRFQLDTYYRKTLVELEAEQLALTVAEKTNVTAATVVAEAQVRQCEALVDEARAAVEMCTVRAKVAGTIERVNISKGTLMGMTPPMSAVILVPAGPRVIRTEVEAEFAHRIGQDKVGKKVTISDHSDAKLTYQGIVRYIPIVFLPRRSTDTGFVPNETRVLEVIVEVVDANPAGKPPLKVGQKVRVNFGH